MYTSWDMGTSGLEVVISPYLISHFRSGRTTFLIVPLDSWTKIYLVFGGLMKIVPREQWFALKFLYICIFKLFKLLLKRQLPAHILRVLINLYTNSCLRVVWGAIPSDYFSVVNGVKQGAVLNPVLFCFYIDDLLLLLKKTGFGCYIGAHFVGALDYADDMLLVAPILLLLFVKC